MPGTHLNRLPVDSVIEAFDEDGDLAVFISLDDDGFAEVNNEGGVQADAQLRVGGRGIGAAAEGAGHIRHGAAEK